jgi:hypothetical protein
MVPVERIELPTFGLQNRCSTAELNRPGKFRLACRKPVWERAGGRRITDLSCRG